MSGTSRAVVAMLVACLAGLHSVNADDAASKQKPEKPTKTSSIDAVPLNPQQTVLLDAKRKRLLLKTEVVQQEALLEMVLCKKGTKEHETIVAIDSDAYVIHAGLLAIGAEPGTPVRYAPEYEPPEGQIIDIFANWADDNGRPHREPIQKWVRHVTRRYYVEPLAKLPNDFPVPKESDPNKTKVATGMTYVEDSELRHDAKRGELIWFGQMNEQERDRHLKLSDDAKYQSAIRKIFKDGRSQEMEADFVFAGSMFVQDDEGRRRYLAESGNIICVANFSDATLDVTIRSTAQNEDLMFEPYTERIPPLGTEVTLELIPREKKSGLNEQRPDSASTNDAS